ncbi:MAG TPA: PKD domain-containing protein [candidate division Zixibacteria bacterium]
MTSKKSVLRTGLGLCVLVAIAVIAIGAMGEEQIASVSARASSKPVLVTVAPAGQTAAVPDPVPAIPECGWRSPEEWLSIYQEGIAKGEVPDPAVKGIPKVGPRVEFGRMPGTPLTYDDVFVYEDTDDILRSDYTDPQLTALMVNSANALMAEHGDQWDYICFWLLQVPSHQFGAAFYQGIENNVSGIGSSLYQERAGFGLAGNNVEGFVMMWNQYDWAPGTGMFGNFTRLVLAQEFEHRFGMFLSPIVGGRDLQGDDASCGRSAHWSFRVDGQGSGMEIANWSGSSPATRIAPTLSFNTDIPDGVWSYCDLYLMGYVSPAEMDAGNSELRFMETGCVSPYNGAIFDFGSAEIIAANGPRIPSSETAQKHFKAAWIMFHAPGDPPIPGELDWALGIMTQQELDWVNSTLGRGTLDNSIARGNFEADVQQGQAPLDVSYTYDAPFTTTGWKWYFGDGDSADVENPVHAYDPGVYDVELRAFTNDGQRYTIKRDFITVWADTVDGPNFSAPQDTGKLVWEVIATNALPLEAITIPVSLTNVPAIATFDSLKTHGCRTEYFEQQVAVFNNGFFGQRAVKLTADFGGGSPPLEPGTGPIAKIYMTIKAAAEPGDTVGLSFDPLEGFALTAEARTATYNPVWDGGRLYLSGGPCACDCFGDPQCDGITNVFDVVAAVDVAFRNGAPIPDPNPLCPRATTDVTCDNVTNVFDVVALVDVAFRNGNPATVFCTVCL